MPGLAALAALVFAESATAGGCSYRNGVDARSRGAAGAGAAWARGALAGMAENPAALAYVSERNLDANLTSASTTGSFANAAGSSGALRSGPFLLPEAAYAEPLGDSRWTLGGGVTPEMMLAGDWRYEDPVGAAGASYGVQRHNSEFLLLRSAGGAAYRFSERLALGGTFGMVYNRNSLQAPYIFQDHPALRGLKTLLDLRTSGWAPDACFGGLFHATESLHAAAVYKTSLSFKSRGHASGDIGAQFAAIGVEAPSEWRYDAEVHTAAPHIATLGLAWEPLERISLAVQGEWHGWRSAAPDLPIFLTEGTNDAINNLLQSTALNDRAPFLWNDRWVGRVGGELALSRRWLLRTGYARSSRVVPDSTLTPLTADVTQNTLTWGVGFRGATNSFDFAYQWDLRENRSMDASSLAGGEYLGSRLGVGLHWLTASTGFSF